jgi:hypothetical protein
MEKVETVLWINDVIQDTGAQMLLHTNRYNDQTSNQGHYNSGKSQ